VSVKKAVESLPADFRKSNWSGTLQVLTAKGNLFWNSNSTQDLIWDFDQWINHLPFNKSNYVENKTLTGLAEGKSFKIRAILCDEHGNCSENVVLESDFGTCIPPGKGKIIILTKFHVFAFTKKN